MSRIPELSPDSMTPEQVRVHAAIMAGPRGVVRGPVQVWLQNPGFAEHAQALGSYCRFHTALPSRLSELAIITTAVRWRAGYEWRSHAPMAVSGGLPEVVVEAIRTGAPPPFKQDDERAVHAFATELLDRNVVSTATWTQATRLLGPHGVLDLVAILGYYALISMTIKAYEIGGAEVDDAIFPAA